MSVRSSVEARDRALAVPELLAFVAGEASGDLLAAPVIAELRQRLPQAQFGGIAGDLMAAQGCAPWWHVRELSVRGYVEVLRELPRLLRLRRDLRERLMRQPPAVMVGVDAPDFNLRLEMQLRARGIPTVHYVSPSIWAWRRGRIEKIRRAADHVLLIFPFEQKIYDEAGIRATYVGHSLAGQIPMQPDTNAARARIGTPLEAPTIAVLPGSRRSEIELNANTFFGALEVLAQRDAALRFVLPVADKGLRALIDARLPAFPRLLERLLITPGRSHDCLEAADIVLVASGTATLETALYKKPMVISYKVPRLTAALMKRMGYVPYIGLPNILSGEFVVPEILQDAATPEALANQLAQLLNDQPLRVRLFERFSAMHEQLRRDTPALAAQAIIDTMQRR